MDMMHVVSKRRSIRRFTQEPVPREALEAMVEAARLSPTGVNRQPLQFAILCGRTVCEAVFPLTAWAGKIPDGSAGPDASTQPTAYIALLVDKAIAQQADTDAGAAAMSMMLVAEVAGLATCWLGSVQRPQVLDILGLDAARFAIHTMVAVGYPAMQSRAVPLRDGSTDYYLEAPDALCVPKRALEDIAHWYE